MRIVFIGVALGLPASFLLTNLMAGMLYNVHPDDPLSFATVTFVLGMVTLLACYIRRGVQRVSIRWWPCVTNKSCRLRRHKQTMKYSREGGILEHRQVDEGQVPSRFAPASGRAPC